MRATASRRQEARIETGLLRLDYRLCQHANVKDFDFRALRLVLGSPSFEYAETEENGKLATLVWSCGCKATQERFQKYCEVQWCEFHRAALLPSEPIGNDRCFALLPETLTVANGTHLCGRVYEALSIHRRSAHKARATALRAGGNLNGL